jgi:hypothetical protein
LTNLLRKVVPFAAEISKIGHGAPV